ncbi:helix-turn-helix transcriptional regulator [Atopomonas sediminilitoris]|uniref:helix-turn-helix transcriptional regulator n=1 Tax=Atopomonas sediminilitoris TaxID=2919919 RepID=UPI001F4EE881|nr:helix-turn-helix transcriptional regulator [Atopomonas sediminilitoris]MCJ8168653.1 helix-turn-helix domain-containing protein [Atopomonas sediminilitoris]
MNRIADLRGAAKIPQVALAVALGWSQGRLSNYEAERRTPSLVDSRAITAALNRLGVICDLDDVFPIEESLLQRAA